MLDGCLTLMPTERSDMAKFSKKGWSSDPNYDNFSSGGLERHIDNLRDDLAERHEGSAKPRRVHETAGYVSGFGSVEELGSCCPTPRATAGPGPTPRASHRTPPVAAEPDAAGNRRT